MNSATVLARRANYWMGTLGQRGAGSHVIVRIEPAANGTLTGTMDNLDAGCMGIPIDEIVFGKTSLRFNAPAVHGSYRGRIHGDGRTTRGIWQMREYAAPLVLQRAKPSPLDGAWAGTLIVPAGRLRLLFYVGSGPDGLIAAMKSPDQSEQTVPITSAELMGATLTMEVASISGRFKGKLNRPLSAIRGKWTQGGGDLPLTLKRVVADEELKPERPQEPSPPYPYREEEVRYRRRGARIALAGTLTIPEGDGPFPALLLIAGSGALDRDETMYDHRPFLVLADYLTRRGFAVLRYDKRGVGESGGDIGETTTTDFSMDARAGVAYLRSRPEVDRGRIGLVGHSEGGLIACMLAAHDRDLAFIVLMAAPGVSGAELVCQQARRQAEKHGGDPEEAARKNGEVVALLRKTKGNATLRRQLTQMFSELPDAQRDAQVNYLMVPWLREFATLNPADHLRRVRCPVLALNGQKDAAVEPGSNLAAIRRALKSTDNRNCRIVELKHLNHLFQTCTTGSETEYWHIAETLSPMLLDKIFRWAARCTAKERYK